MSTSGTATMASRSEKATSKQPKTKPYQATREVERSSSTTTSLLEPPRPAFDRTDTGELLSYYHSPLADLEGVHQAARQPSTDSQATSDSNYTPESSDSEYSIADDIPKSQLSTTRTGASSQGASDRRRLHILDTASSISTRRGVDSETLVLVAPPDVSKPKKYARKDHSPATAPLPDDPQDALNSHKRTQSDFPAEQIKKSREVAVVASEYLGGGLTIPMVQEPQSRSPSPSSAERKPYFTRSSTGQSVASALRTPEIGQGKDISTPVAAPVIVNINSLTPESDSEPNSKTPSSFLSYQPGIHSTAGPLPEPPKASFVINPLASTPPPPRPPRLHSPASRPSPSSRAQSPIRSVAATLASSSKSPPPEPRSGSPASTSTHDSSLADASHLREGAFPPSRFLSTRSSTSASSSIPQAVLEEEDRLASPSPSPSQNSAFESHDSHPQTPQTHEGAHSLDVTTPSVRQHSPAPSSNTTSSSSHGHTEATPTRPSNSIGQGFPSTLQAVDAKRFSSLPRTPSLSSSMARPPSPPTRNVSLAVQHPQVIHEEETQPRPRRPPHRFKSRNPPAMSCADVTNKKSPLERCGLYARKINELYIYDCGLGDWLLESKFRGSSKATPMLSAAGGTTNRLLSPQTQGNRRTSMISHATASTFPQRPDATKATNLIARIQPDDIPPGTPPVLPYPALAHSPRPGIPSLPPSSSSSVTSPGLSIKPLGKSHAGGGFFSSLGRKTSVARRDKPPDILRGSPSANKLMKSPPPSSVTSPKGQMTSPSVPGGPRAPPLSSSASSNVRVSKRAQRSQTLLLPASPTQSQPSASSEQPPKNKRNSILARRPSLASAPSHVSPKQSPTREDFDDQVAKLADLLPHAERNILAAYLRRTGEPMIAIGQYLEDEKTGRLRKD